MSRFDLFGFLHIFYVKNSGLAFIHISWETLRLARDWWDYGNAAVTEVQQRYIRQGKIAFIPA